VGVSPRELAGGPDRLHHGILCFSEIHRPVDASPADYSRDVLKMLPDSGRVPEQKQKIYTTALKPGISDGDCGQRQERPG
jgi:hypothetical protein